MFRGIETLFDKLALGSRNHPSVASKQFHTVVFRRIVAGRNLDRPSTTKVSYEHPGSRRSSDPAVIDFPIASTKRQLNRGVELRAAGSAVARD